MLMLPIGGGLPFSGLREVDRCFLLPSEKDLIEPALQEIVQKLLEAEMDETVGGTEE